MLSKYTFKLNLRGRIAAYHIGPFNLYITLALSISKSSFFLGETIRINGFDGVKAESVKKSENRSE